LTIANESLADLTSVSYGQPTKVNPDPAPGPITFVRPSWWKLCKFCRITSVGAWLMEVNSDFFCSDLYIINSDMSLTLCTSIYIWTLSIICFFWIFVHLACALQARESCEGPEILPVNIDRAVYKVANMLAYCRGFTRALLSDFIMPWSARVWSTRSYRVKCGTSYSKLRTLKSGWSLFRRLNIVSRLSISCLFLYVVNHDVWSQWCRVPPPPSLSMSYVTVFLGTSLFYLISTTDFYYIINKLIILVPD
jgi:hypothetical protein